MKKFVRNTVIFIVIFAVLFAYAQNVFHYRWPDNTYSKMVDYKNQPADSVDVAVFGTSEMYQAYAPIVTYEAEGLTGFNFAVQNRSAMTTYYQFRYMLKHQRPKVVVCDFVCLFDNALPSESETIFRRVVDTMPDPVVRFELIREICRVDPTQQFMSWMFPVFRYHSMWKEFDPESLTWDTKKDPFYACFDKGANLNSAPFEGEAVEITPELWQTDRAADPIQDFSMAYYDRMIADCKELGIPVVCILTPKVCDADVYESNVPAMQAYFESKGVTFLNYNTYEQVQRLGLSQPEDYFDPAHLNTQGAVKFSRAVAADLKAMFPDLPDRRSDARIAAAWDADLAVFKDMVEEVK
ncbi:MAG: hypothetical protein IKS87_08470 [Lachnospiraceae bacterium]|nr:hypothetical protein [Lachnospiraceae bacterium]